MWSLQLEAQLRLRGAVKIGSRVRVGGCVRGSFKLFRIECRAEAAAGENYPEVIFRLEAGRVRDRGVQHVPQAVCQGFHWLLQEDHFGPTVSNAQGYLTGPPIRNHGLEAVRANRQSMCPTVRSASTSPSTANLRRKASARIAGGAHLRFLKGVRLNNTLQLT